MKKNEKSSGSYSDLARQPSRGGGGGEENQGAGAKGKIAMDPPANPNPNPTNAQPQADAAARLAALSLRGGRDLPPDFEIHEHHLDDDDDDDEGYLTAASRGGSSTCAWKGLRDDDRDGDDVSPPSPSSSGYAGERGSSLDDDPDPEPEPAQDWPRDKKHLDEVSSSGRLTSPSGLDH